MAFEPENPLEKVLVRATTDAAARPEFYRLLMGSNLFVLGEIGRDVPVERPAPMRPDDRMQLVFVTSGKEKAHPIFTALSRLRNFAPPGRRHFCLLGRDLFASTKGAQFVLNPGSEFGKKLMPDEIEYWLSQLVRGRLQSEASEKIAAPKTPPTKLVKALGVLFVNRQVKSARLAEIRRDNAPARLALAVDTDSNWRRLCQEIAVATEAASPGLMLDLVRVNSRDHHDPLSRQLLEVAPFYERKQTEEKETS